MALLTEGLFGLGTTRQLRSHSGLLLWAAWSSGVTFDDTSGMTLAAVALPVLFTTPTIIMIAAIRSAVTKSGRQV